MNVRLGYAGETRESPFGDLPAADAALEIVDQSAVQLLEIHAQTLFLPEIRDY